MPDAPRYAYNLATMEMRTSDGTLVPTPEGWQRLSEVWARANEAITNALVGHDVGGMRPPEPEPTFCPIYATRYEREVLDDA